MSSQLTCSASGTDAGTPAPGSDSSTPVQAGTAPTTPTRHWGRLLKAPEVGLIVALVVAVIVFALINTNFLATSTALLILRAIASIGIVAVAEAILLITHEFDLSVGAVAGLGALTAGTLMTKGMPTVIAILLGVLIGAGFGLINGLLITQLRIPALVATLGMMFVAAGLSQVVTGGFPVSGLPDDFRAFGRWDPLGIPIGVWVLFVIVVLAELVLRRTVWGRRVYATGGNWRAARLTGLRPDRVKIAAFTLAGVLAVIAGVLSVGRVGSGDPSAGTGWELQAIAGAVVGGVSLFGGTGRAIGALLGTLFLQVVTSGLVVIGVDTSLKGVAVGVFLVAAIAVDRWRQSRVT